MCYVEDGRGVGLEADLTSEGDRGFISPGEPMDESNDDV
jgi:hypothetical protein